jgi:hypothetical protein
VHKLFIRLVTKWQWKSLKNNVCVWNFAANLVKILQRHFNCLTTHTLGALSSCSAYSVLVDALFKKFGLFLIRSVHYVHYVPLATDSTVK